MGQNSKRKSVSKPPKIATNVGDLGQCPVALFTDPMVFFKEIEVFFNAVAALFTDTYFKSVF
jgi:hypothetical protein